MTESEVDFLWDIVDDLEWTLEKLKFKDYEQDDSWDVPAVEEYAKKYGSRDADLWYVLFGVVETLGRLGWDMYQDEDKWWSNDAMDRYADKWGVYRGR